MKTVQVPSLDRETRGLKLFPFFTVLGWLLIGLAILAAILVVSPTAAGYWGGNAKEARDAAALGSAILGQLSTLAFWSKFLPPLIFLGVASFIVGIALQFASIPALLDRRAAVLKRAIPLMGGKAQGVIKNGKHDAENDETLPDLYRHGFHDRPFVPGYRRL